MKKVPDRKRLRREYLRNKQIAYAQLGFGGALFVAALIMSILSWIGVIIAIFICVGMVRDIKGLMLSLVPFAGMLFFCFLAWLGKAIVNDGYDKLAEIPFSPSVTVSTLPAEEVLVRAADGPSVVQSEVLLRAAQGIGTPMEELLRVSQRE